MDQHASLKKINNPQFRSLCGHIQKDMQRLRVPGVAVGVRYKRRERNVAFGVTSLVSSVILVLVLSACSTGSQAAPTLSVEQAAATLVAMTFQAATRSAAQPSIVNTPAATPTLSPPTFYINGNVQCRTGTGPNFKVVAVFTPGTTVEMMGKDPSGNYWLVKIPNGTETCWLQTIDGTPGGSYESLPAVTPQPSTQSVPILGGLVYNFFCSYNTNTNLSVTTYLSWTDASKNANGFRIYRANVQIADLPANTTTFTDTTNVDVGTRLIYGLEAYNDAGVSPQKTIGFICQ